MTEKQIHTEKSMTLGTVFLYRPTLKILRSKSRKEAGVMSSVSSRLHSLEPLTPGILGPSSPTKLEKKLI